MAKPSKNSPKPKIKAPSTFQVIDAFSQLFNEKTLFDEPMYNLSIEVVSNTNKNHEKNIGEITKIFKKHLRPL